mgnify:CR=1 FL=1
MSDNGARSGAQGAAQHRAILDRRGVTPRQRRRDGQAEIAGRQRRSRWLQRFANPVSLRFPLVDPDTLLTRLVAAAGPLLRPGGALLMGTVNPVEYAFDRYLADTQGILQLKYPLPYSDATDISEAERTKLYGPNAPYEFSHTLEDQIGGQLDAGFVLTGFYEARKDNDRLGQYFPNYIATRAVKRG